MKKISELRNEDRPYFANLWSMRHERGDGVTVASYLQELLNQYADAMQEYGLSYEPYGNKRQAMFDLLEETIRKAEEIEEVFGPDHPQPQR